MTFDPYWLLQENVFLANLKYEADICLLSPLCAKPQTAWNLPSKASTSFLQQYLVSPPTIFGPFPDNIWSPPVGKCRVRANFLCFTVAYWGQVYNTDWHRIWHKSSLPIDKWSSFAGCDSWINGGRIFIFLCIWLKNQLGKRTGGSQGLTGNNVMTVGRNAPPKTLLAFRNVAEDFHNLIDLSLSWSKCFIPCNWNDVIVLIPFLWSPPFAFLLTR